MSSRNRYDELERTETPKIFVDAGVSFYSKTSILLVPL